MLRDSLVQAGFLRDIGQEVANWLQLSGVKPGVVVNCRLPSRDAIRRQEICSPTVVPDSLRGYRGELAVHSGGAADAPATCREQWEERGLSAPLGLLICVGGEEARAYLIHRADVSTEVGHLEIVSTKLINEAGRKFEKIVIDGNTKKRR